MQQLSRIDDIELIEPTPAPKDHVGSKPITEVNRIDIEKDHTLTTTIAAGGFGATSAAIAYATVGAFASASTGTAISVLSGVAASNATLAFLGGGTLAAGGAGVVGGIAVLGGLVAIPVLAVGGYFFNSKVNKDLIKAEEDAKTVKQFIGESTTAIAELEKIKRASIQLHRLLIPFESHFSPMIQIVSGIIDRSKRSSILVRTYYSLKKFVAENILQMGYTPPEWMMKGSRIRIADFSRVDQQKVEVIIATAQMLKNVLDISIINDEGIVPPETFQFIANVEDYLTKLATPA